MKPHPPVFSLVFVVSALLCAALACTLGSGDEPPSSPDFALTPFTQAPSPTLAFPTSTPQPTPVPVQTQVPPTQINCTPVTYWLVYYVRPGDTLGQIAERSGASVAQLVQANCLANSDLIYVDQPLYVPAIPVTLTPIPVVASAIPITVDANSPVFVRALSADKHWLDGAGWAVTYYDTVRVNSGEALNADRVDFYVDDPGAASAIHIGQDLDPWDGAFWDYTFPFAGVYTFMAVAENENRRVNSNVFTIRYDPGFVPPEGQVNLLSISPNQVFDGSLYILQAGATVVIDWPNVPRDARAVDFFLSPSGTGMVPQAIGSDRQPADGATITWTVPAGITGHIHATAAMPDGSTRTSQLVMVAGQY